MVQDGPVHVIRAHHQVVTEDQAGYGCIPGRCKAPTRTHLSHELEKKSDTRRTANPAGTCGSPWSSDPSKLQAISDPHITITMKQQEYSV